MDIKEFKKYGHELVDWIADYYKNIESYPVLSKVEPGSITRQIAKEPPMQPEGFDEIFNDFQSIIMPGITHWQHPNFHAYFPANSSFPSLLAEFLTAAIGAQCMLWQTSPAATELEETVMNWLKKMIGLPDYFSGVIQDTASTATLCSLLTAREVLTGFEINRMGFYDTHKFKVYCSSETHSSIEKAVKIAGLGRINLVKIPVNSNFSMISEILEATIKNDILAGFKPLCVVATFGTTSSTGIDPINEIGQICNHYNVWLHVDAAMAGTALILPEKRHLLGGLENVDTFVFNPHKWLFTNFDCSAYFVRDMESLLHTFEIMPSYLKTDAGNTVNNYKDWGIQLGRRFRALKLWFVIRNFGVEGLREKVRYHIELTQMLYKKMTESKNFIVPVKPEFNTLCFYYKPLKIENIEIINSFNAELLKRINQTGKIFLSPSILNGKYILRFVIGQTNVTEEHVNRAWRLISRTAKELAI